MIGAKDGESGTHFTREELIDQLGVFFLAGHETTASALTWVFFILATRLEILQRVREEVDRVVGDDPHAFDPDRFLPEREKAIKPGTYMPFGLGLRICVGAGFAATESTLILARLARRFDFSVEDADKVRPVARLTTRPAEQIMCQVRSRSA